MDLLRRLGKKKRDTGDDDDVNRPDPPGTATTTTSAVQPKYVPQPVVIPNQCIELGTIQYCNLTKDGKHGDYETVLRVAKETGKPIFANFVEWSG